MKPTALRRAALSLLFLALSCAYGADEFHPVPLRAEIKGTLPMTGLVFWSTSEYQRSPAISMEFAYLRYDEVATARGLYDWSMVERLMSDAAARGHQLILRLHDTYRRAMADPGQRLRHQFHDRIRRHRAGADHRVRPAHPRSAHRV